MEDKFNLEQQRSSINMQIFAMNQGFSNQKFDCKKVESRNQSDQMGFTHLRNIFSAQKQQTPGNKFLQYENDQLMQESFQSSEFSLSFNEETTLKSTFKNKQCLQKMSEQSYRQQIKFEKQANQEQSQDQQQILCMNCQNYIKLSSIEKHSTQCTQVMQHIKSFERLNDQEVYTNFKLQKLNEVIQRNIEAQNNFEVSVYLRIILIECIAILNCNDFNEIQFEAVNVNLIKMKIEQEMLEIQEDKVQLIIYIEKLKTLLSEKQDCLKLKLVLLSENQDINFLSGIISKESSFVEERTQVDFSTIQKIKLQVNLQKENLQKNEKIEAEKQQNQLFKKFLKLFMKIKLNYEINHPCQQIQAKNLFHQVQTRKLVEKE